ncbi:TPA: hypothetical protein NJ351_004599 [Vibrio parahaemolyticus]|nr:hypothetical protein [Vibrio parahaemolyticus]
MSLKKGELKDVSEMSVLQIVELIEAMEGKFGVSAAAALVAGGHSIGDDAKRRQINRLVNDLKSIAAKKKESVIKDAQFEQLVAKSQGLELDNLKMTRIFPMALYLGGGEHPELVLAALSEFGESLGVEIFDHDEPIISSFFQKLFGLVKSKKTKEEMNDLYDNGKKALQAQQIKKPNSEADLNVANGAAALLNAMEKDSKSSALFYGGLLILSIKDNNGESHNRIISLNEEQIEYIQSNLNLLRHPEKLLLKVDERLKLTGSD